MNSRDGGVPPRTPKPKPAKQPAPPQARIGRSTQSALGQILRHHYNDLVAAPMPDRLKQLFDELHQTEGSAAPPSESEASVKKPE